MPTPTRNVKAFTGILASRAQAEHFEAPGSCSAVYSNAVGPSYSAAWGRGARSSEEQGTCGSYSYSSFFKLYTKGAGHVFWWPQGWQVVPSELRPPAKFSSERNLSTRSFQVEL